MSKTPEIEIPAWDQPFDAQTNLRLSAVLPAYVSGRRWYRAKARTIDRLTIEDAIRIAGSDGFMLVIRIEYQDGEYDAYVLLVAIARPGTTAEIDDPVCRLRALNGTEGTLFDALSDANIRQALLDAIVCNTTFEGQHGDLIGWRTKALDATCRHPSSQFTSFVSRAEQSNTSIIYGTRYILKLFRKLEEGTNPDIEIGDFLTRRGFKNTPAVLGQIEYKTHRGQKYAAGILQQFVPNQGDAWSYTLESLGGFFERALGAAGALPDPRLLELTANPMPEYARMLLGGYVDSATLLGRRTAQMHAAFEDENAGPDFIPEPFTRQDGNRLYQDLLSQADITFGLLRRKQGTLAGFAREAAREVLHLESEVTNRFEAFREAPISAVRIRHHGDYHLGQVLYTGSDFMIIDFEGEPARALSERRRKALAMRDVAGMVRSFQYAAYAALFGQVPGVPTEPGLASAVESWAAFWTAWISATYLRAYFSEGQGLRCVPSSAGEQNLLLDVFLLQKALYELSYELNNRPGWVRIPLRGILSLVAKQAN